MKKCITFSRALPLHLFSTRRRGFFIHALEFAFGATEKSDCLFWSWESIEKMRLLLSRTPRRARASL
jgi:hypothetical protein